MLIIAVCVTGAFIVLRRVQAQLTRPADAEQRTVRTAHNRPRDAVTLRVCHSRLQRRRRCALCDRQRVGAGKGRGLVLVCDRDRVSLYGGQGGVRGICRGDFKRVRNRGFVVQRTAV